MDHTTVSSSTPARARLGLFTPVISKALEFDHLCPIVPLQPVQTLFGTLFQAGSARVSRELLNDQGAV